MRPREITPRQSTATDTCTITSGSLSLSPGESVTRTITLTEKAGNADWHITQQPGSKLIVKIRDTYSQVNPDAWYVEIADEKGRIDRSIAFPNTNNAPVEGIIPSGNATVTIRYFDGKERFPATAVVQFTCLPPPPAPPQPPQNILANPIIVIYSASWATLIALVLVILWLHQRRKDRLEQEKKTETPEEETKKD